MKKVFFALFAVVIAVGGSAFTNVKVVPVGSIYGSTIGDYILSSSTSYDNEDCTDLSPKTCAYQVTEAGKTTVVLSSYTEAQMQAFLSTGKVIIAPGSRTGLYEPN